MVALRDNREPGLRYLLATANQCPIIVGLGPICAVSGKGWPNACAIGAYTEKLLSGSYGNTLNGTPRVLAEKKLFWAQNTYETVTRL